MRRREVLAGLGASVAGALSNIEVFAADAPGACVLTPQTEDGPFFFDPKLVRADITEGKQGMPLELVMRVVTVAGCSAIKSARADVWQPDALGLYSGYDKQTGTGVQRTLSATGKTFLRGTQFTNDAGAVSFTTIYPSWYTGRTPHIHFKVFLDRSRVITSQIFFPDDVNDQVFSAAPYRARDPVRGTFNHNDTYLKNGTLGVLCQVSRHGAGYRATVDVGVAAA
jgi:protocatechuate 3,4-dioxygenase beta subunit